MTTLLVTNDYPPKIGGIQRYLWELWRRLPSERTSVLTRDQPGAAEFDAHAPHHIERIDSSLLMPTRKLVARIKEAANRSGASFVLLDPALPLGLVGPDLGIPYGVIVHGAELAVAARLPVSSVFVRKVLTRARLVVAAGGYPAREARLVAGDRLGDVVVIPPGVDAARFRPLSPDEIASTRRRLGLAERGRLIVSVSRLVPRKGMDVLIEASERLVRDRPDLTVAIAGTGRDSRRLAALSKRIGAPVELLGRVSDEELPNLVGAADIAAMLCRTRWGGLEQEGFGIVFLEAAATGVPQVAGLSGGSAEAVENGVTGFVVDRPADVVVATAALAKLLDDPGLRQAMGAAARERAVNEFNYNDLVTRLDGVLREAER